MRTTSVAIIGAGIAGLSAAIDLARLGFEVTVFEKAPAAGGKIRQVAAGASLLDAGPTVLTMKWVFEQLFDDADASFEQAVATKPLDVLARHAWDASSHLDLYAGVERTAAAIRDFAGPREAQGFLTFARRARDTYQTLEVPFIRSEQPTPVSLALGAGLKGLSDLWRISPFTTLWRALGEHFRDERLRQLFARYATYVGSSPFDCPATLMLVADVEQQGVWTIGGGMQRLADACRELAVQGGVTFRFGAKVARIDVADGKATAMTLADGERIAADVIIVNADPAALASGLFGPAISSAVSAQSSENRSLSAVTFAYEARASGFPLHHHNVFFSRDYAREFADLKARRMPEDPTVYVCAEDRTSGLTPAGSELERIFCLINAPATGDTQDFSAKEIELCQMRAMTRLASCGLKLNNASPPAITTPFLFNKLFPATGGALYGQASHGWTASFTRPSARTRCPNLYLAGGAVHPGAGVPMAALSGRIAARAVASDRTSR